MPTILILAALTAQMIPASAQNQAQSSTATGTLRGQVTDPSGAFVANATVVIRRPGGPTHSATTGKTGTYEMGGLPAGKFTVTANAPGFLAFERNDVEVVAGQIKPLNIALDINVKHETVDVGENAPTLDTNPTRNASAIVLSAKDLDALPDDPDELLSDLQALAGPSAGPDGGQLYIDGFTAGQLPPKSSIREIRINQNPFSAEYDKLGYGRIEIFTKPGTAKFHGQFSVVGNSSRLNSRNPFLTPDQTRPYHSVIYMGNLGGPINKNTLFFVDVQRRNIDEIAVVNTLPLDLACGTVNLSGSVPNPRTRTNIGPRIDYQVTKNNTLTARYQFYRDTQDNAGVGGTTLPEAGYDTTSTEHTVQISDTQILGTNVINETRFQYLRDNSGQNPVTTPLQTLPVSLVATLPIIPSISVPGVFTGGRSSSGTQTDHQDHYEFQNYLSISNGKHLVKFEGRLRAVHEVNTSSAEFNGSYTFPDLTTFDMGPE